MLNPKDYLSPQSFSHGARDNLRNRPLAPQGDSWKPGLPNPGGTLVVPPVPPSSVAEAISPKFYKTLLVSPIEGLIVVRAQLSGTKLFGERIIRWDLGGRFDQVALQTARDMEITGDFKIDTQIKVSSVRLNVLIYEIADGTLALYFATFDNAGGEQLHYFGSAKLAVLKKDGSWTEIKGPANLRRLAVRDPSLRNNFKTQISLERIGGPSAADQGAVGGGSEGPGR